MPKLQFWSRADKASVSLPTTKRLTALAALARIWRKASSLAYVVPRTAITTIWLARTLFAMLQEASWREDNRKVSNARQVAVVSVLAMASKPGVDWSGYWQRNVK